ncbi:FAAH1 hydrolase, partial [Crocuta crocuta]
TPRPCPRIPYTTDQQTYLCYCGYPSALVTSPVTSPPLPHRLSGTSPVTSPTLPHVPLETGPMISPPVTHRHPGTDPMISPSIGPGSQGTCPTMSPSLTPRSLRTALIISPPLAHRPMETRPIASPPHSHKVLETGISPPLSPWFLGRSYNDPSLSPASSAPTGSFYHVHLKPPDSCEPKPQLDLPLGKIFCGSPLSSQAGTSSSASSPQEGSCHCSHFSPEAHIPAPGSPYCAIHPSPRSTGSRCSPPSQTPIKPCLESILTWETSGSSYLLVDPGTTISYAPSAPCAPCLPCPPCPQESPFPLSSHCPSTVFSVPSPLGNQFISPPHSSPHRSCNETPLPTPVCPQVKSPKSSELKHPRALHRCRSLVVPLQHTPLDQPRPPKASSSPSPPSRPSGPSCMVTPITTCSNPCPKELPQGTTLPPVIPRALKPVIPTCLPLRLPFGTVPPNSYAQSSPRGLSIGPPCSTQIYSVVPSTPDPCPLLGSLSQPICPPQGHKLPMVPPCGIYSTPRAPAQPYRQPVAPPCSTHIYSFIPLRAPFDPQNLPIGPQTRCHPDTVSCGFHVYSVAPRVSCKECPQVPYSCPLPSSKTSNCSTNVSSSSAVISECQSSDSQSKSCHESRSQSQNENTHQPRRSQSQSKSLHPHRSQSQNRSPSRKRSRSRSNCSHQSINQDKSECHSKNQGQSESSPCSKSQGQSKSG